MKSDVTPPGAPVRMNIAPGELRSRSATSGVRRRARSSAVNVVTLAPTWSAGASVRVAVTTTVSCTGATPSTIRSGAASHGADADEKPVSDASRRQPGDATRVTWKRPFSSENVLADSDPDPSSTRTNARGNACPDWSTTVPVVHSTGSAAPALPTSEALIKAMRHATGKKRACGGRQATPGRPRRNMDMRILPASFAPKTGRPPLTRFPDSRISASRQRLPRLVAEPSDGSPDFVQGPKTNSAA